jgi:hypothetical protein
MNPTPINDERLKLHEVAVATALVVAACAGVAVAFTAIATCQYAGDTIKRIRRRGGRRHVPR